MKQLFTLIFIMTHFSVLIAQCDTLFFRLSNVIQRACEVSPEAQSAKHKFRSEYWSWRSFRADYLPMVNLVSNPTLIHSINPITMSDGSIRYVKQDMLNSDFSLSVIQNFALTGGYFFLNTGIERTDLFTENNSAWQTNPVTFGYAQSLFGYNALKWNKKIMPVRYEKAKKEYAEKIESVARQATACFFNLATAQSNYGSALINFANADTLYMFAKGRYDIGTITENEMLQLEINRLVEETNKINALLEVEERLQSLRSFLNIPDDDYVCLEIEEKLPEFVIDEERALEYAFLNGSSIQSFEQRRLESESNVAYVRGNTGVKADLYMKFGLTQTGKNLRNAYCNPMNQQYVSLGLSLPLVDWGKRKGQLRVAESNRALVYEQVRQERIDFEMDIRKSVNQFNLQLRRVKVAAKTNKIASQRKQIAQRLFILGKSSVLDLNASVSEKDQARRNYLHSLYTYWDLYYKLRSLTLYDFERDRPIFEDYENLIK